VNKEHVNRNTFQQTYTSNKYVITRKIMLVIVYNMLQNLYNQIFNTCRPFFNYCLSMSHILIFIVGVIVIYGFWVRNKVAKTGDFENSDILMKKFANCEGCDLWAVSHLLLYALLGYMFPQHLFLLMIIGVIWEFIEDYLGTLKLDFMGYGRMAEVLGAVDKNGESVWWFGRVTDIAFNMIGLISGYEIARLKLLG
jgi:hypothetical protein